MFLDRDGVLNDPVPRDGGPPESPLDPAQVRLARGAADGVIALREAGWELVVVSNQPGAAKGEASADTLTAVHARVAAALDDAGAPIAHWRYCHHHPDAVVPALREACDCRKPAPGLLLQSASELDLDLARSWMIGDTDADIGAARAAGVRSVLVEAPLSEHRRSGAAAPDHVASDLLEAALVIGAAV